MIERGGAGSEQASGDHGEIGIAGSEPHEDERPLFVQADEKLARTGGDDLGGDFGGTQAEGFGHVGAAEELDQEAPAAGFQVGGLGSQHQPLRFLGRLSQRRGPQAVVAGGDDASPRRAREGANALGNLRGDGVGVKQHLEEGIRGDEVAQQRRRAGELPALREIEEGLLGRLVLDPFGHAFAQPDPGGKTRQFGTPEARYQDRLTSLEAFDERYSYLDRLPRSQTLVTQRHDGIDHPVVWVNASGPYRTVYDALGHGVAAYDSLSRRRLLARESLWLLDVDDNLVRSI